MNTIDQVQEFHEAFEYPVPKHPCLPGATCGVLTKVAEIAQEVLSLARVAHALAKDSGSITALRAHLMLEELGEVLQAIGEDDLVAVTHELCDKRYVDDGTVIAFGLRTIYDEAFRRIHAANMSKLDENGKPVKDASGRVVKSQNFRKAFLDDLLEPTITVIP